jgi:hypothetical protein
VVRVFLRELLIGSQNEEGELKDLNFDGSTEYRRIERNWE